MMRIITNSGYDKAVYRDFYSYIFSMLRLDRILIGKFSQTISFENYY